MKTKTFELNCGKKTITIIEKQNGWGLQEPENNTVHIAWNDLANGEFCGGIAYMQFGKGTETFKKNVINYYKNNGYIPEDIYTKETNMILLRKTEIK